MTQEAKNKRLFLSLMLLIAASVLFYFLTIGKENDIVDKSVFKVENLESIDKVVMQSGNDSVEVKFSGSGWVVNERFKPDPNMIDVLFATLREVEPRRPVASTLRDSISSALDKTGVHVSLYSGDQRVMAFVAGGNADKTQAYFKEIQNGNVYLVAIPGYRVYASGIFEIGEKGFRSKYVFDFNWRNFKSLKVEFPAKTNDGFEVGMGTNYFTITGMTSVDTAKLNTFLDRVSTLQVDEFLQEGVAHGIDNSVMVITIDDVASRKYELILYASDSGKTKGLLNGEAVYFDQRKIVPLLRPRSFFVK